MIDKIFAMLPECRALASPPKKAQATAAEHKGVAIIPIVGTLTRTGRQLYGDESTTATNEVRSHLRAAGSDDAIRAAFLYINSPGGSVAGTAELGDAIAELARRKPVVAYCEDVCASAAYWAASQATRIYAGRSAVVGSIGTYAILADSSAMLERVGIKLHLIKAGAFKGAGTFGTALTEEQLNEAQRLIEGMNSHFLSAITAGRKLTGERLKAVSDGRVHLAADAMKLGLVDGIAALDESLNEVVALYGRSPQAAVAKSVTAKPVSQYELDKAAYALAAREVAKQRAALPPPQPVQPRASAAEEFNAAVAAALGHGPRTIQARFAAMRAVARRQPELYTRYLNQRE